MLQGVQRVLHVAHPHARHLPHRYLPQEDATQVRSPQHGDACSLYFPTWTRRIIGDFAITIAIVAMVGLDMFAGIDTPKLNVPSQLRVRATMLFAM